MTPSRETLLRLAAETGFQPRALEIVMRLGSVLAGIGQDEILGPRLLLKGGTALNLAAADPPRLSVDLDFNDIGAPEREQLERDRPVLAARLERIAARAGYTIQRSPRAHAGQKFYFAYPSALGGPGRIQVDLNYLARVPLLPPETGSLWSPGGARIACRTVSFAELVAGKLLALVDRTAARDLYDVATLAARATSPASASEKRVFIALAGTLKRPLFDYRVERLARVEEADLRANLAPLLRSGQHLAIDGMTRAATEFVAPLLDLDDAEREYTERIQVGELVPELLFPDDEAIADRLRRHPALLWKAENARRYARGARRKE